MKKNQFKRLATLVLSVALLNTHLLPINAQIETKTPDRTVEQMLEQPNYAITKAEFARLINTSMKLESEDGESFKDVFTDNPYAKDLLCAKKIGYFTGDINGNVSPDKIISGVEASVAINYLLGFDLSKVKKDSSLNMPDWAKPAATNLIDLNMIPKALAEKKQLTVEDANQFVNAISVALNYSDSPYALKQVSLQDDFYNYVNRQYLATATPVGGYPFSVLHFETTSNVDNQISDMLKEIVSNKNLSVNSDEWKIKQIYEMYMDNSLRTKSIEKLTPIFDEIRNVQSIDELRKVTTKYSSFLKLQDLYLIDKYPDSKVDARKWSSFFLPGKLGLESKDYYANDNSLTSIQSTYKKYIADQLKYIGETKDLEARAQTYYNFEKSLADHRISEVQLNDANVLFTPTTWDEIDKMTANTKFTSTYDDFFKILKTYNVYCPDKEYVKFADSLYTESNLQYLKDMALINVLNSVGEYLGDDYLNLKKDLSTIFSNFEASKSLEMRAQSSVQSLLKNVVSKMYAEKYCSPEVKADVTVLADKIKQKQIERIQKLDWLSPKTKEMAADKIKSLSIHIGYPDDFGNISSFDVVTKDAGGTLIDVYINSQKKFNENNIKTLHGPVGSSFWEEYPNYTVNALYVAGYNSVYVFAGYLQEPLYSLDYSEEEKLGMLGAVIGHEITHAIDSEGAKFDKYGTMTNWWTEDDYAAFEKLTANISNELSKIQFTQDKTVNGELCKGEAIADLGGLASSLDVAKDENLNQKLVMEAFAKNLQRVYLWNIRIIYYPLMNMHQIK